MELSKDQVEYCMECGVCTGSCPVSRQIPTFSPRQAIKRMLMDRDRDFLTSRDLWSCLLCARCSARCPVKIDFPEFVHHCREEARKEGFHPQTAHHGVLQAIAALQTRGAPQRRTDWAKDAGKFVEKGDVFYFVGCAPYHEVVFRYLGVSSLESARSVLRILNRLGIEPVISNEERCCGHDALYSGDDETFKALATHNLELIKASGAKTVVFACPEGYLTFTRHYAKLFGPLPFEVVHLTEFLARELPASGLTLKEPEGGPLPVTFQDPCRLGRFAGIYEPPRDLLKLIPGVTFSEMERSRENAVCCGTTAWMECSACSKGMQIERLQEAIATGAKALVTACPKCRIHFTCARSGTDLSLDIVDLYTLIERSLA